MPEVQYVTFVTTGGTPVRIAQQTGAPYPTTGYGALVFARSPTLYNPIINGAVWSGGGVTNYTSDHTLTADQVYQSFTNLGATVSVTLTLPTPVVGYEFTFFCVASYSLILDVGGSVQIAVGEIIGAAGGGISTNSPYSALTLKALTTTLWVAKNYTGTWTPS